MKNVLLNGDHDEELHMELQLEVFLQALLDQTNNKRVEIRFSSMSISRVESSKHY